MQASLNAEVEKIYSKNLKCISQSASLADAEGMMNNYNIRHLPVLNENDELTGIVSKSDFIALKYVDSRLQRFKVQDFVSSPVRAVHLDTKLEKVIEFFINHKVSSVIVVDRREAVGILTTEDLLRFMLNRMADESRGAHGQLDLALLAEEGWISSTTNQSMGKY